MHDAKPVLTLLVLCGCGLLWLGLHWVRLSAPVRGQRLTAIAVAEEAETLPPTRLAEQARWLLDASSGPAAGTQSAAGPQCAAWGSARGWRGGTGIRSGWHAAYATGPSGW